MLRTFQHWIVTKWLDYDNLHMKFSALNVDFSSPSPDLLGSRRPARLGVKDSYPPKMAILPQLFRVAWKRLQIGTYMLLIITSFLLVSMSMPLNDLEWITLRIFLRFPAATHFKSELRRNGWRWTWTTCTRHFQSIERTFLRCWVLISYIQRVFRTEASNLNTFSRCINILLL